MVTWTVYYIIHYVIFIDNIGCILKPQLLNHFLSTYRHVLSTASFSVHTHGQWWHLIIGSSGAIMVMHPQFIRVIYNHESFYKPSIKSNINLFLFLIIIWSILIHRDKATTNIDSYTAHPNDPKTSHIITNS